MPISLFTTALLIFAFITLVAPEASFASLPANAPALTAVIDRPADVAL